MNKLPTLATSAWCEPCKQLKVQLEDMGIQVELADMTNDTDYFILHKIRSVPTANLNQFTSNLAITNPLSKNLSKNAPTQAPKTVPIPPKS